MVTRTYLDDLLTRLAQAGDRPVVRHQDTDTRGGELLAAVHRTARTLADLRVGRGSLVAMYAPNHPEALAVRYATHLLGAASVFLSAPPDPDLRARMLVDFRPDLVVVWPQTAHLLPRTTARIASMGPVAGIDLRLDELSAAQPAAALTPQARADDLAVLISSGGTTGVPKGSVRDFATWSRTVAKPSPPDRRQLANGKLAYLTQILVDTTVLGGGTVVLQDGYEPLATLAAIQQESITDLFLVEPQLFDLMDHPDLGRYDLRSLRALTHIGDAAAPVLRRRARDRFGAVVAHTYGASEMGIVSALPAAANTPARFTCAGQVLPGVALRFRTPDGLVHPNQGLVEVRSPDMAQGYRYRPADQAAHFAGGWYATGDRARVDDEGFLHVHGRAMDCTDDGGRLVTPVAVQDAVCRLPGVRYAAVVTDPADGSRIVAVVPWPGSRVDHGSCREAVRSRFGRTVANRLRVLEMSHVPLTEQGKVDRPAIRRLAA